MTVSHRPPMNEELLSAYLDNEVTDEERSLVEAAMAADPAIAWQVDSLRQTIQLLQELPTLALPRAFTIEAIVHEAKHQEAERPLAQSIGKKPAFAQKVSKEEQTSDWWQWLQQIWQGGNLPLRNAAALAFTLMLVLFMSNRFVAPYQPTDTQANAPIILTATNGTGGGNTTNSAETREIAQRETTPILTPSAKALAAQPPVGVTVIQEQAATTATAEVPPQNDTTTARSSRETGRVPGADEENLRGDSRDAMQPDQSGSMASPMQANAQMAATASLAPSANASSSLTTALSTTMTTTVTAYDSLQNQTTSLLTATVTGTLTDSALVETVTPSVSLSTDITDGLEQPILSEAVQGEVSASAGNVNRWLGWAQLITALCTVILGGLWWRSRG